MVRVCDQQGYMVRVINAATTAEERKKMLNYTKTDRVDLHAIVQSILQGRGDTSRKKQECFERLQTLTRARGGWWMNGPAVSTISAYIWIISSENFKARMCGKMEKTKS
ncbi:IS110 family transposase [Sporosarcina sp. FSL W7-1283]|uniref:IS110 family transposase n=1 Tax=Sporosarcina sp. FSL W7-1283 TaxID=2921560 RepID=UPI0030F57E36